MSTRCSAASMLVLAALLGCGRGSTHVPLAPNPPPPSASVAATPSASAAPSQSAPTASASSPGTQAPPTGPTISIGIGPGRGRSQPASERPQVQPIPFRVADLPAASLPEPPAASSGKTPNLTAGEPAADILVKPDIVDAVGRPDDYSAMVNVKDAAYAQLRVGNWNGWSGGVFGASGGASVRCGTRGMHAASLPAHWTALRPSRTGVELAVTTGWFDRANCKAAAIRRGTVVAKAVLARGLVVAFRSCAKTCAEKEQLVLLMPRAQMLVASGIGGDASKESGAFTRVALPLRKGGGGSMMARLDVADVQAWLRAFSPGAAEADAQAKGASFATKVLVGVEVSQGVDDPEPVAVVYIDENG